MMIFLVLWRGGTDPEPCQCLPVLRRLHALPKIFKGAQVSVVYYVNIRGQSKGAKFLQRAKFRARK